MNVSEEKKLIRKEILSKRDLITEKERLLKSKIIIDNVLGLPEWEEAKEIYLFASFGSEPNTFPLIENALKSGKRVSLPRIIKKEMKFIEINSLGDLVPGTWGILEPKDLGIYNERPGIVIVPGVAFGRNFYRVGYGAGYYDRFFSKRKKDFKMFAIGFDFQLKNQVPHDEFDVAVDIVITDKDIIRQ